jgi:hypothetical protein
MIYRAKDVDLSDFDCVPVCYMGKNTRVITEAIEVTEENIGRLCLEFESELAYAGETVRFEFKAHRGTPEDPAGPAFLTVMKGFWIIILWGEIHIFRDKEFKSTFSTDVPSPFNDEAIKTPDEIREEVFGTATVVPENPEDTKMIPIVGNIGGVEVAIDPSHNYVAPPASGDFAPGGRGTWKVDNRPAEFTYPEGSRTQEMIDRANARADEQKGESDS